MNKPIRTVRGQLAVPVHVAMATARRVLEAAEAVELGQATALDMAYHHGALTTALGGLLASLDNEEAGR